MRRTTRRPNRAISEVARSDINAQYGRFRYDIEGVIGGRYYVHARAAGGNGHVYLCYDTKQDYFYALKTLILDQTTLLDSGTFARLEHEVNTWMALGEHENIVQCFGLEVLDELPYIVLEWVADTNLLSHTYAYHHQNAPCFLDWYARLGRRGVALRKHHLEANRTSAGTTLQAWIESYHHLPPSLAVQLALDICQGLAHAQSVHAGFVHRDIKPDNILMTEQRRAKLSDFGTAILVRDLIYPGEPVGTPGYMAPEQVQGDEVDERADIYGLGCLLYQMLVGKPPYGETKEEFADWHNYARYNPPTLPQAIPRELGAIVRDCLQYDMNARPSSIAELSAALATFERGKTHHYLLSHKPSAEELNQTAVAYYNLDQFDEALAELNRAIEIDSSYPNSYTDRGCIYHVCGENQLALEDYAQAIRLGRDEINAKVRNNRGLLYLVKGQPKKALSDLRRAIEQEPNYANAHGNLGMAYATLGEYEQALTAYNHALSLNRTHVIALHNRAYLHEQTGNIEAAIADYESALNHAPAFLQARLNLYALYSHLDKFSDAEREKRQLERLHPTLQLAQETKSSPHLSRPDPQLLNTGSLARVIAQPFLDWEAKRLAEAEASGALLRPPERMPLHAMGRVTDVDYSDWLHGSILAQQADGQRATQMTIHINLYEGTVQEDTETVNRECSLRIDETAMRQMEAAGLKTIYELKGRILVVHNDHPHNLTHPLRIWAVH